MVVLFADFFNFNYHRKVYVGVQNRPTCAYSFCTVLDRLPIIGQFTNPLFWRFLTPLVLWSENWNYFRRQKRKLAWHVQLGTWGKTAGNLYSFISSGFCRGLAFFDFQWGTVPALSNSDLNCWGYSFLHLLYRFVCCLTVPRLWSPLWVIIHFCVYDYVLWVVIHFNNYDNVLCVVVSFLHLCLRLCVVIYFWICVQFLWAVTYFCFNVLWVSW